MPNPLKTLRNVNIPGRHWWMLAVTILLFGPVAFFVDLKPQVGGGDGSNRPPVFRFNGPNATAKQMDSDTGNATHSDSDHPSAYRRGRRLPYGPGVGEYGGGALSLVLLLVIIYLLLIRGRRL